MSLKIEESISYTDTYLAQNTRPFVGLLIRKEEERWRRIKNHSFGMQKFHRKNIGITQELVQNTGFRNLHLNQRKPYMWGSYDEMTMAWYV